MKLFSCFGQSDSKIEVYRSQDLAIFALLDIGRKDTIKLMSIAEQVDPHYHRKLDIKVFANKFCEEYSDTFLYLFRIYFNLIVPKKVVVVETVKKVDIEEEDFIPNTGLNDNNSIAHSNTENESITQQQQQNDHPPDLLQATVTEDNIDYHYLFSFLLLFMSIPDYHLSSWLFWLCYTATNIKPDHNSLETLITTLWPKKMKFKLNKKIELLKKKAQNQMIIVDIDDLNANKLRIFDINTNNVWTKPLQILRKKIKKNSKLNYFFWLKINKHIYNISLTIDDEYNKLKDNKKLTKWGKKNIAIIGERKNSRKFLRNIIRLHLSYINLLIEYDNNSSEITSRRNSIAKSINNDEINEKKEFFYEKIQTFIYRIYKNIKKLKKKSISTKIYPTNTTTIMNNNSTKNFLLTTTTDNSIKFHLKYNNKYNIQNLRKFSAKDWIYNTIALIRKKTYKTDIVIIDKEEFIKIENRYQESLNISINNIYKRINDTKERNINLLNLCENDIKNSHFDAILLNNNVSSRSLRNKRIINNNDTGMYVFEYICIYIYII